MTFAADSPFPLLRPSTLARASPSGLPLAPLVIVIDCRYSRRRRRAAAATDHHARRRLVYSMHDFRQFCWTSDRLRPMAIASPSDWENATSSGDQETAGPTDYHGRDERPGRAVTVLVRESSTAPAKARNTETTQAVADPLNDFYQTCPLPRPSPHCR